MIKFKLDYAALISLFALFISFVFPSSAYSYEKLSSIPELHNAGVLLIDKQGKSIVSTNEDKLFIPASTTKLITAWLALNHWGESYHFKTHFYFDVQTLTLWIKGSGDPFLISEELLIIAKHLKRLGLSNINTIGLDNSLFDTDLTVPGASTSNNPYDAIPSSLAANFNTLNIKQVSGSTVTAESQTPITVTAKQIASQQKISAKPLRINTGRSLPQTERYFAELFATFLRQQGINVNQHVIWGKAPIKNPYYTHENSKSLAEVIQPMMKYSTNFIANQLVLVLSAEYYQSSANFDNVQNYMQDMLFKHFNWKNFILKEGAGLSRDNRISPKQLVALLNDFKRWKHLLPEVTPNIFAKSGTLNKVSTLAGYTVDKQKHWNAFALMMTQPVRHSRRNKIIRELAKD